MLHICIHHDVGVNGAFHSASELGFFQFMNPPPSTPVGWNLRLGSRRNLEDPEFMIQYGCSLYQHCALHNFSVTWPVFSVVRKSYRWCFTTSTSSHVVFVLANYYILCCHTQEWANNANKSNRSVHFSSSLQMELVCDIIPSSEFQLPR